MGSNDFSTDWWIVLFNLVLFLCFCVLGYALVNTAIATTQGERVIGVRVERRQRMDRDVLY